MRLAVSFFLFCAMTAAGGAAPLCREVAKAIETRARAGAPPPERLSAGTFAGLSRFEPATEASLSAFPLAAAARDALNASVLRVARAGGAKGLVLVDAEAGTAHCHTPHLFSLASGVMTPVAIPAPEEPFARCGRAMIGLGEIGGRAFLLESDGGDAEAEQAKIASQQADALSKPCSLSIRYRMDFRVEDAFCAKPELCRLGAKASVWARAWKTGGPELRDPAFSPAGPPNGAGDAFPLLGGAAKLTPAPLAFDAEQSFFRIFGEPEADGLRIGAAKPGPANMADWESLTLVALYLSDRPVASFIVQRRRAGLASVTVNPE